MSEVMYLNKAMAKAAMLEMENDDNIVLIGEDVVNRGGGLSNFIGVPQAFPDRCYDMPLSEQGYTHFSVGAALAGQRPIVDLMFSDFVAVCADTIINSAPKHRFFSLGKISVPIVFCAGNGGRATYGGVGSGANHSQCIESWFTNVPGLKIVTPYYPGDAFNLMRASIRDNDPVLLLYHEGSLGKKSEVTEDSEVTLSNAGRVIKEGNDVTIVAIQSMVPVAEKAVEYFEKENISVEIIDPRVLVPFDEETLYKSIRKTGRLVIIHEAHKRGGFGGEIAALASENCFKYLKAPIQRVGALNAPIPSGYLETYMMPNEEDLIRAVEETMK